MKKSVLIVLLIVLILVPQIAGAALKIIEDRMEIGIDVSTYSLENQISYKVFQEKCSQHHGLYRPIQAIKNGKTPVTESPFGKKEVKKYIIKMMRKPNSGVDRDSAKSIIKFIYFLIDNKENIKEIKN